MKDIQRLGVTRRWADAVIYGGVARFVEVAAEVPPEFSREVSLVLSQLDATLRRIGSDRSHVLQVLIFVSDLALVSELNEQWDTWFPEGTAPVRACVEAKLQAGYRIELVVEAAVTPT